MSGSFQTIPSNLVYTTSSPQSISSILNLTNTTNSTSVNTGSLIISGGIGVAGNINVGSSSSTHQFLGNVNIPTAITTDNSTLAASTAYVKSNLISYATLASPTFTGIPLSPTPLLTTNTTQIATTAFVTSRVLSNCVYFATLGSITPTLNAFTNFAGTFSGTLRSGFGDTFTSPTLTIGQTGVYLILGSWTYNSSAAATPTVVNLIYTFKKNTTNDFIRIFNNTVASSPTSLTFSGFTIISLNSGDTITPQYYLAVAGGLIYTLTLSGTLSVIQIG